MINISYKTRIKRYYAMICNVVVKKNYRRQKKKGKKCQNMIEFKVVKCIKIK